MFIRTVKQLLFITGLSVFLLQPVVAGQIINKCRDSKGVWHYGDVAAQECQDSEVSSIDSSGVKISVKIGPTAAERKRKQQQQETVKALRKQQLEQQRKDNRLLKLYDSEQAIILARDKRLQVIDQEIGDNRALAADMERAHQTLLQRLESTKDKQQKYRLQQLAAEYAQQVVAYRQVEKEKLRQRQIVLSSYNHDLIKFRDLLSRRANPAVQ